MLVIAHRVRQCALGNRALFLPRLKTGRLGASVVPVTNEGGRAKNGLMSAKTARAVLPPVQRGIGLGAPCAAWRGCCHNRCSSKGGVVMSQTGVGKVVEQLLTDENLVPR
jgi:hypothetical protein